VRDNPNLGALNVMKQVGYEWKNITEEKKQYFQNKADIDKARYIKEMAEFYDEVERIGERKDKV
jgi:HMG (high mobility group) box